MPRSPSPSRRATFSGGGELALVELIRRRAMSSRKAGALKLGIGDDCAILMPSPGDEILVTTDFSLEGRHFRRDWHPPRSVGHRTLARGLSDLASMGAKPLAAFLSLALPRSAARDTRWLDSFLDGLLALGRMHRVPLAGGDLAEAPGEHILADIILLGSAPAGTALRRSGARPGELLYCTGALGGAAVELAKLPLRRVSTRVDCEKHPQLFPAPRLEVGSRLRKQRIASACIDLSDGLSTDLAHLCKASGLGAEVDAEAMPLHPLTAKLPAEKALDAALHGGEDYELLFTAPEKIRVPGTLAGVTITKIGRMVSRRRGQPQVTLIMSGKREPLQARGWEHLR